MAQPLGCCRERTKRPEDSEEKMMVPSRLAEATRSKAEETTRQETVSLWPQRTAVGCGEMRRLGQEGVEGRRGKWAIRQTATVVSRLPVARKRLSDETVDGGTRRGRKGGRGMAGGNGERVRNTENVMRSCNRRASVPES